MKVFAVGFVKFVDMLVAVTVVIVVVLVLVLVLLVLLVPLACTYSMRFYNAEHWVASYVKARSTGRLKIISNVHVMAWVAVTDNCFGVYM